MKKPTPTRRKKRATTRAGRTPYDAGTPEALARKAALLGGEVRYNGNRPYIACLVTGKEIEPQLAENPLGVCFAHGLITRKEFEAGARLERLRSFAGFARPKYGVMTNDPKAMPSIMRDDEQQARSLALYKDACNTMAPEFDLVVIKVCCYQQAPHGLGQDVPTWEVLALKKGLTLLVSFFGME